MNQPLDDSGFPGGGVQMGIGIPLFFQLADLNDALRPLVEETQDLIVDSVDLFPVVGKISGHERTPSTRAP